MDYNELNSEFAKKGLTIPRVAVMIGIGKKALYQKMRGETQFKQNEIRDLKNILTLSDDRVIELFFCPQGCLKETNSGETQIKKEE